MNYLKEPKIFKKPRLYLQDTFPSGSHLSSRIRIIYPDGHCEWLCQEAGNQIFAPCWATIQPSGFHGFGKCASAIKALNEMRIFDERMGWLPAVFLGEL